MMWTLTYSVFMSMKWASLAASSFVFEGPTRRTLSFLFLWPGMDINAFLGPKDAARKPRLREWGFALSKTILGLTLVYVAAPALLIRSRFFAAWIGMVGIAFTLLFGVFDLLSLVWRRIGVDAKPIMRCPIRATSLSEYWGRRWNLAFRDFVHQSIFRPLRSRFGSVGALVAVFLFSGIVHEGVISGSTGTGWGKPTLFFGLQALGIVAERSRIGTRIGLGRGVVGWAFCWGVIGITAPLTFTRPFLERVVLPTLDAVGAV